jgi:mRNA-degrading endonuclease HigB of HigAB toxin-antitoxin module
MNLVGRQRVAQIMSGSSHCARWLNLFMTELGYANWKRESDIKEHFPRSQRLSDGCYAFPIEGTRMSVRVAFSFKTATALIVGVSE